MTEYFFVGKYISLVTYEVIAKLSRFTFGFRYRKEGEQENTKRRGAGKYMYSSLIQSGHYLAKFGQSASRS